MLEAKTIDDFINDMVKEKEFENLDQGVLEQVKKDLKDQVENHINAAILSEMPEDKLEEFEKLLDTKDSATIQQFVSESIPNLDVLVASELLNFRGLYLN